MVGPGDIARIERLHDGTMGLADHRQFVKKGVNVLDGCAARH
jgi:hypothetical protein